MIHHLPDVGGVESSPKPPSSPLYEACRKNDRIFVEGILSNISDEELNRIEPNGSTALHVAAYYGHNDIVRLLLEKGASYTILNQFGLTAAQEARTEETRKLFKKPPSRTEKDRFLAEEDFEWLTVNERAADYAAFYRAALEKAFEKGLDHSMLSIYLKDILRSNPNNMQYVIKYANAFFATNDPTFLLKAYTVESNFYRILNKDLAKMIRHQEHISTVVNLEMRIPGAIAALISHSPTLESLSFIGETFRGMLITKKDLDQYKVGSHIMIKSFVSTSKERNIAEGFTDIEKTRQCADGTHLKFRTVCHYSIRHPRSALAVESVSHFPWEKEVVILPLNVFKVKSVKQNNEQFEIKLVEEDRLVPYPMDELTSNSLGMCPLFCHLACPCCYRLCCIKYCGAIDPDL